MAVTLVPATAREAKRLPVASDRAASVSGTPADDAPGTPRGESYVPAARRAASAARALNRSGARRSLLYLAATSAITVLLVVLAYRGRMEATTEAGPLNGTVINLSTVTDPRELEAPLAVAFPAVADRRFAAQRLFSYLSHARETASPLRNVGSILEVMVPISTIEQAGLIEYGERARRATQRPAAAETAPASIPLFTSDDLAALKPVLSVRTRDQFASTARLWAGVYLLALWSVALLLWLLRRPPNDYSLLIAAHLLTAIGLVAVLGRPDPLRDAVLFVRYVQGVAVGCFAFAVASLIDFRTTSLARFSYLPLAAALGLAAVLTVFGSGPAGSQAKVNLGPVQPVEAIRLLLALFLAGYFANRWELLRQIRGRTVRGVAMPAWLHLPRADYVLPVTTCVAAALLFFFVQKDLGPALFLSCVFLAAYAIARARVGMAAFGLLLLVGGFVIGWALNVSSTLTARVQMWQSAWDNAARGGDQIAQAMWALSTGGLLGTGLGLGDTRYLPAGHTDLVLAAIGEELGLVGVLVVAAVFVWLARRGLATALRAATDYGFFLAAILTLCLVLPVLMMAAGMLGVAPLTGVVTPFLSYGGSAMVANFAALGLLAAIGRATSAAPATAPFRGGVVTLGRVLGVAAAGLAGVFINVQIVSADSYAVRPHLGLQGDGVRRFQYNQRVLDVAARIPRGTVTDRDGLPLATSDPAVARTIAAKYKQHRLEVSDCAVPATERCYPLEGAAFHVLGDAGTRRNWSASNTSYVERDLQDRLRGYDDHARLVTATDGSGRPLPAVRRDYSELLPLLRNRRNPDDGDVTEFMARRRDVALTIDAPFQLRVARILSKYAARSATRRAAAVVIDPETGDVLASVSYPFPRQGDEGRDDDTDAVLDRARYGLYPPGSTFKIVTAAAALRASAANHAAAFTCTHQPPGRIGARVPGFGVVRDDVLDTEPHGRIAMRGALVRSCNAYFSQLAVDLGPRALLDTASLLGISVARDGSVARVGATLAHAAYGQGDVVATPLRMARVAGAIAAGGVVHDTRIDKASSRRAAPDRLLPPAAARRLASDLREAVMSGTGRSLASHPWRIAGKTGTAEVNNAPSHAWFVGFAPHGDARKRIAFAVLIENAGYGGRAAAPAAGEIVTAAGVSGLVSEEQ